MCAGCGFVQFRKWAQAENALEAHNGKTRLGTSEVPLVVKFADAKRRDQHLQLGLGMRGPNWLHELNPATEFSHYVCPVSMHRCILRWSWLCKDTESLSNDDLWFTCHWLPGKFGLCLLCMAKLTQFCLEWYIIWPTHFRLLAFVWEVSNICLPNELVTCIKCRHNH